MAELEGMLGEGRSLEERRQFEEAIAVYARALSHYPKSGDCQLALGRVYTHERRYPEAVNAYFQAGALLLDADRPDEAHRAYSALIKLEKELATGYSPPALQRIHNRKSDVAHGMGRILYLRGSHEQALRLVTTALENDPNHVGMRTTLGLLHQDAGREAEALEQFLAVVKMHRGNLDEARCRERLAPLVARKGAHAGQVHEHYLQAATFYEREGKLEKALSAYGAALQTWPDHEETLIRSAGLLLSLERTQAATDLFVRLEALSPSPKRREILAKLEELYQQSGRSAAAAQVRQHLEGLSQELVLKDLMPGFRLVLPIPDRIPALAREEGAVRLDFPTVDDSLEGRAGSAWLTFHPQLLTDQDVLEHMAEFVRQPAERLAPQVTRSSLPLGEWLRLTWQEDTPGTNLEYVILRQPRGALSVVAFDYLPGLDWSAARLVLT